MLARRWSRRSRSSAARSPAWCRRSSRKRYTSAWGENMKIASRVTKMQPSLTLAVSAKANKLKAQGVDVIAFGVGEPDFDTPDHIKEVAVAALKKGVGKYTPVSG